MDSENLAKIFDIEDISDFRDFDQFSVLIEDVNNVDEDIFYEMLDQIEPSVLEEMIENYFEDIKQGVPDDNVEIYGILSAVSVNFQNRIKRLSSHSEMQMLIDEIYRFRQWYMKPGQVKCKDLNTGQVEEISICESFICFRMEKLNEGKFEYDFSFCEEFLTDEYLDDYFDADDNDGDDDDADDDEYSDGLINKHNPVIDGEDYDEDEDDEEYE